MTKKHCILTSLIRLACLIAQEGSYYVPVVKNGAVGQVWHQILQVGLLSFCDEKRKRVHFQEEEMTQQHRERFVFGCSGEKNKKISVRFRRATGDQPPSWYSCTVHGGCTYRVPAQKAFRF